MRRLKEGAYGMIGRIYIPAEIRGKSGLILHISDTPTQIFPAIRNLIRKLKPRVIIHTGDLADDLKLEFNAQLIKEYRNESRKILRIMEFSSAEEVYIAMGNHDRLREVEKLSVRSRLVEDHEVIQTGDLELFISHYYEEVEKDPRAYNLFGHNPANPTKRSEDKWFINGVAGVNVINPLNGKVYILRYPWFTDDYRYRRRKSGL